MAPRAVNFLRSTRSSAVFIVVTISYTIFVDTFLYGLTVPVLPYTLIKRSGISEDKVEFWLSTTLAVYGAAWCTLSPLIGWLSSKTKRLTVPILLGTLLLFIGTLMIGLSKHIAVMVVGRLFQGAATAITWSAPTALLVKISPEDKIGQYLGYVGLANSLGNLLAPTLGGILYAKLGYWAVWGVAFGVIALQAVLWFVVKIPGSDVVAMQDPSSETSSETASEHVAQIQDKDMVTILHLALPEKKTNITPLLRLLASPRLSVALGCLVILAALTTTFDSVLANRVKDIFHWNSLGAGTIYLALIVPTLSSPLTGKIADRQGARWLVTSAMIIVSIFLPLLSLVKQDSMSQKVMLCVILVFIGVAFAMWFSPVQSEISRAAREMEKDRPGFSGPQGSEVLATSLSSMAYAFGCTAGPVLSGFIYGGPGWTWMCAVLTGIAVLTIPFAAHWLGGKDGARCEEGEEVFTLDV